MVRGWIRSVWCACLIGGFGCRPPVRLPEPPEAQATSTAAIPSSPHRGRWGLGFFHQGRRLAFGRLREGVGDCDNPDGIHEDSAWTEDTRWRLVTADGSSCLTTRRRRVSMCRRQGEGEPARWSRWEGTELAGCALDSPVVLFLHVPEGVAAGQGIRVRRLAHASALVHGEERVRRVAEEWMRDGEGRAMHREWEAMVGLAPGPTPYAGWRVADLRVAFDMEVALLNRTVPARSAQRDGDDRLREWLLIDGTRSIPLRGDGWSLAALGRELVAWRDGCSAAWLQVRDGNGAFAGSILLPRIRRFSAGMPPPGWCESLE